ncbi:7-dehydrocholesterol reductase [Handroanthus impetiginosus]|uniref:7-dehydrocholesterol reductase n=1 Tax=Handroanthus impetiginosus TaxID=429701 RepID=A0A2G9GZQ5_9LAMI|nr:7-dehydrocholesterol reductase [Handroanthus impetiginosus]
MREPKLTMSLKGIRTRRSPVYYQDPAKLSWNGPSTLGFAILGWTMICSSIQLNIAKSKFAGPGVYICWQCLVWVLSVYASPRGYNFR